MSHLVAGEEAERANGAVNNGAVKDAEIHQAQEPSSK
jgi:hypothetical protein